MVEIHNLRQKLAGERDLRNREGFPTVWAALRPIQSAHAAAVCHYP